MLQCMDVLRINLYIVYRECNIELDPTFSQRNLHKKYLLGLIDAMIRGLRTMKRGLEDNAVIRLQKESETNQSCSNTGGNIQQRTTID